MIRSSTGGSHWPYHAPSGYTTAIGPPSQMRKQFTLLRRMPPCSDRPSSRRRRLRNSHASSPRAFSQHFGVVWSQQRKMCRCATGTPIVAAISRCNSGENSDTELLRVPLQPKLARRRHVADERRGGDDGGAGKVAFTADAHAVLPVAIERCDGALSLAKRVRALAETGPAPRLANLSADRSKHLRDRLAAEARIGALDLPSDTARPRKDNEL